MVKVRRGRLKLLPANLSRFPSLSEDDEGMWQRKPFAFLIYYYREVTSTSFSKHKQAIDTGTEPRGGIWQWRTWKDEEERREGEKGDASCLDRYYIFIACHLLLSCSHSVWCICIILCFCSPSSHPVYVASPRLKEERKSANFALSLSCKNASAGPWTM